MCLEKLHRHPLELQDLPLEALWEILAVAKLEAEEIEAEVSNRA